MKNLAIDLTHTFRKWELLIVTAVVMLGMAMVCRNASAQSGAGSIQGTVADATGAVIPGALVQVVNKATGVVTNTKSNQVGFYQVPGIFTGTYDVTITAPNMKTYERSINLLVDQTAVINPVMTPGAVTQRVEVNADLTQLVDKENGTVSTTLERGRIDQIPMNGRALSTLTNMTVPGMEGSANNTGGTNQRLNGLMGEGLEYVADGVPLNNLQFGGQVNSFEGLLPDPDAVQEVQIEASNTGAQYTAPSTAIITTRSGTNQLHGSAFETARNNAMGGTAKMRQVLSSWTAPQLVRNEFGASVGGPIVIPHIYHGKDKSFFFFAYERFSLVQEIAATGATVPTLAERSGNFSGLTNGSGTVNIYDPSTTAPSTTCPTLGTPAANADNQWCRQQFAYQGNANTINPTLLDPITKTLFAMTPLPTTSATNVLAGTNYTAPDKNVQTVPTITFRLDHNFNDENRVFLRYGQNTQATTNLYGGGSNFETLAAGNFPVNASGVSLNADTNFAAALGYTHIFSPRFFAETNLSQQWFMQFSGGGGPHTDFTTLLGLPNAFNTPGFPSISGMNTTGFVGNQNQYQQNSIDSRIEENLTKLVGDHQLQFGGLYRHERIFYLPSQQPQGPTFTAQTTGLEEPSTGTGEGQYTNQGLADADYFLGGAAAYKEYLEPVGAPYTIQILAGYIQDDWHARRDLTVNIGLRYEAHPGQKAKDNITSIPDLAHQAIVLGDSISDMVAKGRVSQAIINAMESVGAVFETPAQAGFPSNLFVNDYVIFLPRVGFSWQPFGDKHETVLRGGFGRYTYQMADRSENPTPTGYPFSAAFTQDFRTASQSPDGLPNYNLRAPQNTSSSWQLGQPTGTPVFGVNTTNAINANVTTPGAIVPGSFSLAGPNPDYKPDMVTEANLSVEHALPGSSVARIGWVFTHGTNLDQDYRPNVAMSAYAWELNTGTPVPNGGASTIGTCQYAATALNPFNCNVYGDFNYGTKTGWSNYNALQAGYQRLAKHGLAYQVFYVWSRPFRFGGNSTRDSSTFTTQDLATGSLATMTPFTNGVVTAPVLPPARPAGVAAWNQWRGLERFEQYNLDSAIPQQHLQFNWVADLPVGRGKPLLGNANRFMDELVGGWQFAGDGQVLSQDFQVSNSNWGVNNPITVFKHNRAKVTNCTSGVCHPQYLWFNGYISPKQISGNGGTCTTNCVTGLPADYVPYSAPINNDPTQSQFGTNNVMLSSPALLASNKGNPVTVAYLPHSQAGFSANPWSHTFLRGPVNYNADASLYKVFPITERVNLRMNWDVFNVFNIQGLNNPNTGNGLQDLQPGVSGGASSYWQPRQMQLTARLTF